MAPPSYGFSKCSPHLPEDDALFACVTGNGLFMYLDDLIVASKDLVILRSFLWYSRSLHKHVLKVKLTECEFLKSRI